MKKCLRRVLSLTLCVCLIATLCSAWGLAASAATTKVDKTYDIAVVYDNSGSMYMDGNPAWSQAKFSMEIFASMLDYKGGDRLTIFPMYDVTFVDNPATFNNKNNQWTGDESFEYVSSQQIVIAGKEDIDKKIANMYTPYCGGTPDTQIFNAHDYLSSSSADEKWLIVLTDGAIQKMDVAQINYGASELESLLLSKATNGIKVQYLYFGAGGGTELSSNEAKRFYAAKAVDGASLQKELLRICNRIFQRDELPSSYLDGNTLSLDLSMKSLIVFVQGTDAVVRSLKDVSGKAVGVTLDSGRRTYSKIAHGRTGFGYSPIVWDDSLAGQVVNFSDCAKGSYILDYAGVDSVQVFYEPDVKLNIQLLNSDGEAVDAKSGKLPSGDYIVKTDIVDSATGEDVTTHPLMGGNVVIKTYVTTADGQTKSYANGSPITLTPDSKTDIRVEAEYLDVYKITSDDMADADLPWPKGGFTVPESPKFKLQAVVSQPNAEFKLDDMKNWQPIKINATIKEEALTAEQMGRVKLKVELSNDMAYTCETRASESAYRIEIGKDENGDFVPCTIGDATLKLIAEYTDDDGEVFTDVEEVVLHVKSIDFVVQANVEQSDAWYALMQSDAWKPVKVTMTADGRPLTDEELAAVSLTVSSSSTIDLRTEMLPGQSAYYLHVAQDADGNFVTPETGDYVLSINATIGDEYGNLVPASAKAEFTVETFTKLVKIALIVLPFLILFLLWLWFMTRKVLPKKIGKDNQNTEIKTLSAGKLDAGFVSQPSYNRRARKLTVSTTSAVNYTEKCNVVLKLRPVDNRFTKSRYRRIQIVGIESNCKFVSINGVEYTKIRNGVWGRTDLMVVEGQQPPPIKQDAKDPIIEAVRYNDGIAEATMTVKLKNLK